MKQEFIDFVNALIEAAPDVAEKLMTENVKAYMEALTDKKAEKPILTDNGKLVLKYLQGVESGIYKAKDIAEGLFLATSRAASGALRKLITDGYVTKIEGTPICYSLTDLGMSCVIPEVAAEEN